MTQPDMTYRQVTVNEHEFILLKALLEVEGQFVSGSQLASRLGVSRPAVRDKLEKLRETGFDFEAVRNRGYRITRQSKILHPALLRYAQEKLPLNIKDLLYFPAIDSTNNEADRQISYGRETPFAVLSSCQTKGRGRLGRDWYSASANNLYLSVAFEPNIPPASLQHFTLWAGIHICQAVQIFVPQAPLKIKWPNDLHCLGRKFAGMLTEAKMDADGLNTIIFGIGLNINSNPMDYPENIRHLATSLYAVHGEELPMNEIATHTIKAIHDAYETCIRKRDVQDLATAWKSLDFLAGQAVVVRTGGKELSGIAKGIDKSGALLLEDTSGKIQPVWAGDVTLEKYSSTTPSS